ncbi:hypothetical protein HK102_003544, partial [Quaeritorhiza haematococci]
PDTEPESDIEDEPDQDPISDNDFPNETSRRRRSEVPIPRARTSKQKGPSTYVVEGMEHVTKLYEFLVQWRTRDTDSRAKNGLPVLVSPNPFVNGSFKVAELDLGTINMSKDEKIQSFHRLQLTGMLFPRSVQTVVNLLVEGLHPGENIKEELSESWSERSIPFDVKMVVDERADMFYLG